MSNDNQKEIFEIYKLHSELAGRIDETREGLNKLYAGMITSIVAASILLFRFLPNADSIYLLPVLGALVSISWLFSLHSVTGKLTAKHKVLLELESKISFQFFKQEEDQYENHNFLRRKHSGLILPCGFFLVSIFWLIYLCFIGDTPRVEGQRSETSRDQVCMIEMSGFVEKTLLPSQTVLPNMLG